MGWNLLFWFNFMNVVVSVILESTNMFLMASVGTFLDLFTMMPCVGYLIVGLYEICSYTNKNKNRLSRIEKNFEKKILDENILIIFKCCYSSRSISFHRVYNCRKFLFYLKELINRLDKAGDYVRYFLNFHYFNL